ncbi:MAG: DUF4358 domain-containing protein [Clostridiales bacterium]|nr:DUF4358 domain-containing protein [Clostridiales bacterium]
MKIRIISLIIIIAVSICTFASCGDKQPTYKTDVPVSELCVVVDAVIPDSNSMATMDSSYINGYMDIDVSGFEEYAVKVKASDASIDEYGIFKAPSEDKVSEITKIVDGYFKHRLDIWMDDYLPEEKPKLKNASYKVIGRYVVYCILTDDTKAAVFNAVEDKLLEK